MYVISIDTIGLNEKKCVLFQREHQPQTCQIHFRFISDSFQFQCHTFKGTSNKIEKIIDDGRELGYGRK